MILVDLVDADPISAKHFEERRTAWKRLGFTEDAQGISLFQ